MKFIVRSLLFLLAAIPPVISMEADLFSLGLHDKSILFRLIADLIVGILAGLAAQIFVEPIMTWLSKVLAWLQYDVMWTIGIQLDESYQRRREAVIQNRKLREAQKQHEEAHRRQRIEEIRQRGVPTWLKPDWLFAIMVFLAAFFIASEFIPLANNRSTPWETIALFEITFCINCLSLLLYIRSLDRDFKGKSEFYFTCSVGVGVGIGLFLAKLWANSISGFILIFLVSTFLIVWLLQIGRLLLWIGETFNSSTTITKVKQKREQFLWGFFGSYIFLIMMAIFNL